MIFCVDIGNTFVKMAVVNDDRVLGLERILTSTTENPTFPLAVRRVANAVLTVDRAVISSVVPGVTRYVARVVGEQLGIRPEIITLHSDLPIEVAVPDKSTLGIDRVASACGAVEGRRRNAIIIDAGTAITIDLVRDGRYLGGVITAGPKMLLKAMHAHASQLPEIDYERVAVGLPEEFDNTYAALILGATLGCTGAIREAVRYLQASARCRPVKVITGGYADRLAPHLPSTWRVDHDLTLRGLYRIARHLGNPAFPTPV